MTAVAAAAFTGRNTQPRSQLPPGLKLLRLANRGDECVTGEQTHTGDGLQICRGFVMAGAVGNLLFQCLQLLLQ